MPGERGRSGPGGPVVSQPLMFYKFGLGGQSLIK